MKIIELKTTITKTKKNKKTSLYEFSGKVETTKNTIGELEFIQKENKQKNILMNEFLAFME